jgi:hypothetical protein
MQQDDRDEVDNDGRNLHQKHLESEVVDLNNEIMRIGGVTYLSINIQYFN